MIITGYIVGIVIVVVFAIKHFDIFWLHCAPLQSGQINYVYNGFTFLSDPIDLQSVLFFFLCIFTISFIIHQFLS